MPRAKQLKVHLALYRVPDGAVSWCGMRQYDLTRVVDDYSVERVTCVACLDSHQRETGGAR